ncbi:hypothetical protein BU24DRAFT_407460 [Aaosphaeria arxii CBS 175.79]|uniref:Zn(2)-C6 fungal-type domain-containing protein n=1 Tax=Aaosphaeria arxii CBS 175.79 TaxID=1450172 RepID=A0A6A5XYT0_9PLEO|nr:uncharacterized protein BU24DRAFT_407460 [Aaosphaeria arxii CBS 175.79]KAF2017434.1 hypothetical protein BU24DRAFT_407460 [Aaosphaeria arxii CBS 175.79]
MFPHQGGQGHMPTHWQPPTSQQPANGAYAHPQQPSHINSSLPPPPPQEPRHDMAAHQHPQQPYRLPGPHEWTRAPPPPGPYAGHPSQPPPPPPQYMNHGHQPPAPRQRTAIACRYCRRRKIRCSGFENTDDGRCSNCMRFNQDCIFTPVSAQTQAFVPAHTVWRGVGAPPPMYGAYGQPLQPAPHGGDPYAQQQQQQPPPPRGQQYLPSPTGASGPYPAHSTYPPPPGTSYDEGSRDAMSRKRPYAEPHTPTLPPPNPATASQLPHRSAGPEYTYPDPTSLTSAASPAPSSSSYQSGPPPPPPANDPYYTTQPRRGSPQSNYSASSPHGQAPPASATSPYYPPQAPNGLQPMPPRSEGRTPPPPNSQTPSNRPGMRINDLVSDNGGGRSSTDSDMLNMLNRRPM